MTPLAPRTPRLSVVFATSVALVAASGCSPTGASEAVTAGTGYAFSEVHYALDWDLDGVQLDDGWTVQTDEGFTVSLHEGWAVTLQATLAPCEDDVDAVAALAPTTLRPLLPTPARADHPDFFDPSMIDVSLAEDLDAPTRRTIGGATFAPGDYCGLFWVVGRSEAGTESPDRTAIDGLSLAMSGTWSRGAESGAFDFSTNWPNGIRWELDDLGIEPGCRAEVTFVRHAARLFDAIDFEADIDNAIAWQVLKNLVEGSTPTVTVTDCAQPLETP